MKHTLQPIDNFPINSYTDCIFWFPILCSNLELLDRIVYSDFPPNVKT